VTFAWSPDSSRRGERPSRVFHGGGEAQAVVAADLSPSWREFLGECPDGPFARFGLIKRSVKAFDSAIRRGFLARCGFVVDGQWQYALTPYGRAVRDAILAERRAA
jgi:hypothetical protein